MFLRRIMLGYLLIGLACSQGHACTGIVKKADNGDVVYARTLEFGQSLISFDLLFIPRAIDYTAQTNGDGIEGLKWSTKYAHVGFNPFGMPILADGLNEKGLACGAFYFPGWAEYEQVDQGSPGVISNLDFVSWALGNFATVKEAIAALKETKVIGLVYKPWGIVPPLHYILVDQSGDKAIIEYVKGGVRIYDDVPIGTITNSPSYDWHVVNARNYIGLSALNRPSVKINGSELAAFGQGSGSIGLPGDFTPPSRFIRASFLNQVTLAAKDGLEGVQRAFKILNQFDIPKGAVRQDEEGKIVYEETQWTSAADLANGRYFYHTAKNRMVRFVNLNLLNLKGKKIQSVPVEEGESFVDISTHFDTAPKKP